MTADKMRLRETPCESSIMADATFDLQARRKCVAGHPGMLGSALVWRPGRGVVPVICVGLCLFDHG
jgi:hypothetical protein